MIKFFRKIRQKLLSENKFSKYLIYAIGEIILVVIGILIALQINNWNEERKSNIQGKAYVSEIYREVKKDIKKIADILDKFEANKIKSRRILEILESESRYIADSSLFTKDVLNIIGVIDVGRQNNTWDELSSSGKIAIIDNDSLDNQLKNFYEYYDKQVIQFSETPAKMREKCRNTYGQCLDIASVDRYWKPDGDQTNSRNWFTCFLNNKEVRKDINAIHVSSYWQIYHFAKIKAEGQSIIDYMEQNLNL
ncbi:DUF6090 family protein [Croceitalea marina]|uniref:DUF6090 family protein n=1 Tax=Croceitalea marina TaxID=1775166 RepID=A0ABW5MWK0_9FLAO